MVIPDRWWKRIAGVLFGALVVGVLYVVVWTRIQAGEMAAEYLNACVQAGICPTPAQVSIALQAKNPPKTSSGPTVLPPETAKKPEAK